MNYQPIDVGNRIQKLREEMGLSQEAFAEKLGTSRVHIANIERGTKNPSIDLLIDIAELHTVSLDYLILGREKFTGTGGRLREIANELMVIAATCDS